MNAFPVEGSILVLAVATSQVEKVLKRSVSYGYVAGTLVAVLPEDYPDFSKETIFDCNNVFELSYAELKQKIEKKEINPGRCRPIPEKLLQKIIDGVKISPYIKKKHKDLLP